LPSDWDWETTDMVISWDNTRTRMISCLAMEMEHSSVVYMKSFEVSHKAG
jgi:hypothetical protein